MHEKGEQMVIDIHTHYVIEPDFDTTFLHEMDKAGVDVSVVHAVPSSIFSDFGQNAERLFSQGTPENRRKK